MPFEEQVDISSDESSPSDVDDDGSVSKQSNATIVPPEVAIFRKAKMYQDYMKEVPIPTHRGSVVPCTSWTGLAKSLKQLYGQPLHYLTNIRLRQWDQLRAGGEDEYRPLDTIIHPYKAEANIWLMEEVHRLTTSCEYLSQLWLADSAHHAFIDPIFPKLQSLS